ncbi:MAG: FRG domain-containing protein [Candidatus Saccharimonas sp.]|nr:FRG domain-containing protein [Planctomycetaceae bacterium]
METIGKASLWSFVDGEQEAQLIENTAIRKGRGHRVKSYLDLATKVAELQFRNRDVVLLFRGQKMDHRNRDKNTTLKPTLLRPNDGTILNPGRTTLTSRFESLKSAEEVLVRQYGHGDFLGVDRLKRYRILRWSILQHYEVCATPLLDVTHSLRIAASFASLSTDNEAFLFAIGVPNLSGAITASAEAGLQIIRLSSVCPPSAVRPHIQEGYLLGEYPELADVEQRDQYLHVEMDFGRRLVAKFRFDPKKFWGNDAFPAVGKHALYPTPSHDPLYKLAIAVKLEIALP